MASHGLKLHLICPWSTFDKLVNTNVNSQPEEDSLNKCKCLFFSDDNTDHYKNRGQLYPFFSSYKRIFFKEN